MNEDEIEQMNARGPFDHGVWNAVDAEGNTVTFGTSSLFATRAEVMSDRIVSFLTKTYTVSELASFHILDVGCYDGWVLSSICERIQFAASFGVEPRQKNIDKGKFARKLCRKESPVQFFRGGYDDLESLFPGQMFDIVLCLGMLHHVNSVETVIRTITRKTSRVFIVDSMIIPPLQNDFDAIAAMVNPVDIVYRNREKTWGMSAYKFESPYFDGSTSDADLVNIPQESLIRMCLQAVSFDGVQALMTETDFYPKDYQALRGVNEVMLAAFRGPDRGGAEGRWKQDAREYETLFCVHQPSERFVRYLQVNFSTPELTMCFAEVLEGSRADEAFRSPALLDAEEREIASTVPRGPYEKVLLELAKYQISRGQLTSALALLRRITTAKNADWRSFYRACFLLSLLEQSQGNDGRAAHYRELLAISNPMFPSTELEARCGF